MTLRGAGVAGVAIGAACVGGAYLVAWRSGATAPAAAWLLVAGNAVTMATALLLGARGARRSPWLVGAAALVGIMLIAAFAAGLLLPAESAGAPLVLGLPARLAYIVYGVGVLPVFVLPMAFARDFSDDGLDPGSLAALRREAAELRGEVG
jgi:hypothetical protein